VTFVCGLVSDVPDAERRRILGDMVAVLLDGHLHATTWHVGNLSIARLDLIDANASRHFAVSLDGARRLWVAGETYSRPLNAAELLEDRRDIADLDGEYHIAMWNSETYTLKLINDRFGGLPLYTATRKGTFAFAGGVRGILAVPGVEIVPDETAIREAVSFGGFRLGGRTNIANVTMVPGATETTWDARSATMSQRRYWTWRDIETRPTSAEKYLVQDASALWKQAISRRLQGGLRLGQTLSGGLDSRVILAEASAQTPNWTAITYGVDGCDDARYAKLAAERANAIWRFMHLYEPGWLDLRSSFVQCTDGLIDLHDLGHLESLPLQSELIDVHLSGYIGDAVSGPTFTDVHDAHGVLRRLPFYGGELAMSERDALSRAEELIVGLEGAPARFALFEHKLPQSTNRWTAAWRPWFQVRKPFVDYEFFDFFQSMSLRLRRDKRFYERWLRSSYPPFFRTIPNQRTGVPVGSSWARWQATRAMRLLRRKIRPSVRRFGLLPVERKRGYTQDDVYWRTHEARRAIESTILRDDSLSCMIFGRERVHRVLNKWFDHAAVATTVIGALYVYEAYHRDVAQFVRERIHRAPE
jgi:asparagine synthase (glutamine-hydrolysing)